MQGSSLPKVCVVLGAGASNDVWNGSAPILNQGFRPPLARDLFDIDNHRDYWDLLHHYPGARWLTGVLAPQTSTKASTHHSSGW